MKAKLTREQVKEARRKLETNTYRQVARDYEVSVATLRRYLIPKEREQSLGYNQKKEREDTCVCGEKYEYHPKCPLCEALLHNLDGCDCAIQRSYDPEMAVLFAAKILHTDE